MQILNNTVSLGIIFLSSVLWIMEQIAGGTVKSKKRVATIGGFYPPGADQIVRFYYAKSGALYGRSRKALGRYLQRINPALHRKTTRLFN